MFSRENDVGKYQSFSISNSIAGVFGWMFYGLIMTFLMAFGLYLAAANNILSPETYVSVLLISSISYIVYSLIATFAMAFVRKKSISITLYTIYALLLGACLSSIFITFEFNDIVYAIGTTALIFGIMALYGYFTKRDLTGFASILSMLFIGVLVMSFVNLILSMIRGFDIYNGSYWLMSYLVLGIIIGYVAFDVQRIKYAASNGALRSSLPVYLAFCLYSDFIAIFLRILLIIAKNKD